MDNNLRDRYIVMIKQIFHGKFNEFEFIEGSNYFKFKQLIPKMSNDKEQYYAVIKVESYLTFDIVYESTYYGEKLETYTNERFTKSSRFWLRNKFQIEWFKKHVDTKKMFGLSLESKKNDIVEKILEEKHGINIYSWHHKNFSVNISDKYRDYIMSNTRLQDLLKEVNKEIELFEIARKV